MTETKTIYRQWQGHIEEVAEGGQQAAKGIKAIVVVQPGIKSEDIAPVLKQAKQQHGWVEEVGKPAHRLDKKIMKKDD